MGCACRLERELLACDVVCNNSCLVGLDRLQSRITQIVTACNVERMRLDLHEIAVGKQADALVPWIVGRGKMWRET